MQIMVVGGSQGLGRAFVEGLGEPGDTVIGVSRRRPALLQLPANVASLWVEADLAQPERAVPHIAAHTPHVLDVLVYNLGIWEPDAFTAAYDFAQSTDQTVRQMVDVNLTAPLLLCRHLLPHLLRSTRPRLVLIGSTSALRRSGRPEVTFGATKSALNGLGDALREHYREAGLGVTTLQLGNLNTDDALNVPLAQAAARDAGQLVPVHDVVALLRTTLRLSDASFVRELVLAPIRDPRY